MCGLGTRGDSTATRVFGKRSSIGRNLLASPRSALRSEHELTFVVIVAPATQGDVLDARRPAFRVGLNVMELQEHPLAASVSGRGHEGAPARIALPDVTLDVRWDVPGGSARFLRLAPAARRVPWLDVIRSGTDRRRGPSLFRSPATSWP